MTFEEKIANIIQAVEALSEDVGCGDNSCSFIKPKGMATNGGCRCYVYEDLARKPLFRPELALLYKTAMNLRKKL